ncbi:Hypothetical_protein [Hexamita inflata]|uniref:Hypothetical_protein n=1 Tax=Hexamita inflata TaxID=28002 RepID=A0AA86V0S7_9EUKA|nr:Hypothetical protein HINF_LOCUS63719 [Hexamita inflata]
MKQSQQNMVRRETATPPEEGHYERRQASRVREQDKKAKPKATLDRTGSEQPSRIEDLEHERVRKISKKGQMSSIKTVQQNSLIRIFQYSSTSRGSPPLQRSIPQRDRPSIFSSLLGDQIQRWQIQQKRM